MRLPGVLAPSPCAGRTELFFAPANGETKLAKARREAEARGICEPCPDRTTCLSAAIANNEPAGIWAGYDPDERRSLARAYRRLAEQAPA